MRRWLGWVAGAAVAAVVMTAVPAEAVPIWTRIADGLDRYDTAVKLSFAMFPDPPDDTVTVLVASGQDFPDALSASAAAAAAAVDGGPVLLTPKDELPDIVRAELTRIDPLKIVLVGGTGAVSTAVENALKTYGPVSRVAGATRFDTSAALSQGTFPTGAPVAYVATGVGSFADALSGGAAAGSQGGPVLLVAQNSVPTAVGTELDRLNPSGIVVLGGELAVSNGVVDALRAYAPNVERIQGATRFSTSAAVSKAAFTPDRPFVFLVTGHEFPDGLAAAAIGGARDTPVLLTRPGCLPAKVKEELDRLDPGQIYVVGGGVLSPPEGMSLPICRPEDTGAA